MALSPVFVELKASIGEFKAKMGEAEHEIGKLEKKGESSGKKLAALGKGVALGFGGVAVAVGGFGLKMADDWERAHASLETSIRNAGGNMKMLEPAINAVSDRMEKFGFTNTQTEDALAKLTLATGSPKKALAEMGLAADIARNRHIDLATASMLLAKGLAGNLRPLKAMGINTDELAKALKGAHSATEKQDIITKALTERFRGSAAAASATFAGKLDALKAKAQDMGKEIGLKLIPVIERLITWTMSVVHWLGKHREVSIALGAVIGGVLLAALAAYTISMISAAAATLAATWPILAVIAVIGLMVAGVIYAYTHWKWFREIVQANVRMVVTVVQWMWSAIQTAFHAIASVISWAWANVIQPTWHAIRGGLSSIADAFRNANDVISWVWNDIATVILAVWNNTIAPIWSYITQMIGDVTSLTKGLSSIGGGILGGIGSALGFASGTSNFAGGPVTVGEHGKETVFLPPGSSVRNNRQTTAAEQPTRGGDVYHFQIDVHGPVLDVNGTAKALEPALRNVMIRVAKTKSGYFPARMIAPA